MLFDKKTALLDRLRAKNLDQQFRNRIQEGMGCSPFVSEAICKVVKDVYLPVIHDPGNVKPGQLLFSCLSKTNGASVPVKEAKMVTVTLTLDAGTEDMELRTAAGVTSLRQHRIVRLCNEAYSQGGLLTVEDLAYRLLNVGERTIHRDLACLRENKHRPPLRSTVKDMGRTVSHRALLIKHWLNGDELSDLQRKYHHSLSAIESYINTFKRVVLLEHQKYSVEQSAYVLKVSQPLVRAHRQIWREHNQRALPHRRREILEMLQVHKGKKTLRSKRRGS